MITLRSAAVGLLKESSLAFQSHPTILIWFVTDEATLLNCWVMDSKVALPLLQRPESHQFSHHMSSCTRIWHLLNVICQ